MKQSTPYPLPSSRVTGGSGQGFPVIASPSATVAANPSLYRAGSWSSAAPFAYGTGDNMADPVHAGHAFMLPGVPAPAAPLPPTVADPSYHPPGGHSQNFLKSVATNNANAANDAANFAAAAPTPSDPTAAAARSAYVSGHRAQADNLMLPYAGPNSFEGNKDAAAYAGMLPRFLDNDAKLGDASVTGARLGNDAQSLYLRHLPGVYRNEEAIGQAEAAMIPKQGDAAVRKSDAEAGAITSRTGDVAAQNKALQTQINTLQHQHDTLQRQHQQALQSLAKYANDPLNVDPNAPAGGGTQPAAPSGQPPASPSGTPKPKMGQQQADALIKQFGGDRVKARAYALSQGFDTTR